MPKGRKKKELPPLVDGLEDTHIVQKSRPLFSLWQSDLTLAEFKILDTYLSRIDSHNPEQRSVELKKSNLEKLLGVKKINRKALDLRLKHLSRTTVDISNGKDIDRITLFERVQGIQDENGLWQITLTCTQSAMKYIFNIDKLGYLRYQIRSITKISSLYSYILFTYIESNRKFKTWEVSLQELKNILNCNSSAYNEFKEFNRRILKKSQKELTEKTDQRFTYEPIKTGRKVTKIKFTVETVPELIEHSKTDVLMKDQLSFEDIDIDYGSELHNLLGSAACDNEFTPEQITVICDYILQIIPEQNNMKRCDYLISLMHKMNYYHTQKPINNRFNYLVSMLKKEISE